jgi:sterol desaturase/sphingolipid hydroxylase (fatty acid hydroxylase superfamily)
MGYYELVTLVAIGLLMAAEGLLRRNPLTRPRYDRWMSNIGFGFANELIRGALPFFLSLLLIDAAWRPLDAGALGPLTGVLVAFVVLDLAIYWVHRVSHRLPWLWRLHRTHHCDLDVDVTTSFRHHPGEFCINLIFLYLLIGLCGFTPTQVLFYVLAYQCVSLWSHSNFRLPEKLENSLSVVLVTPRVHQIHHSAWRPQTDSNYGQIFTFWDRLFGTYTSPTVVSCPTRFGLEAFRSADEQRLRALMLQPVR